MSYKPVLMFAFLFLGTKLYCQDSIGFERLIYMNDTLDLNFSPIVLDEVILYQSTLSAKELLARCKDKMTKDYKQDKVEPYEFFLRVSESETIKLGLDLTKTTMDSMGQDFLDELIDNVPSKAHSHQEGLYRLKQDDSTKNTSVQLIKGFTLEDPNNTSDFSQILKRLYNWLESGVNSGHYYKVRSGIFGSKLDEEDLNLKEIKMAIDSVAPTKEEEIEEKKVRYNQASGSAMTGLGELAKLHLPHSDPLLRLFEKPNRFDLKIIDRRWYKEEWVYVLTFEEKSGDAFSGELWINEEDYGLVMMKCINGKPIRSFQLLGLSYSEDRVQGNYFYVKNINGVYRLNFARLEKDAEVRMKRPFMLAEKKKGGLMSKKVNEIKFDVDFYVKNTTQYTFLRAIGRSENISSDTLPNLQMLKKYPEYFWDKDRFPIPPSKEMKEFKLELLVN